MLSILQENFKEQQRNPNDVFCEDDFAHPDFKRKLSDYLLGVLKEQLLFYYDQSEFELFLKFFEYLQGRHAFTYKEYIKAYSSVVEHIQSNNKIKPLFFDTPDTFLQFLYDLNILCYIEETQQERFFRWCFRERSPSNLSPKVKANLRYEVHYAIQKALNLGKSYC